MIISKTPLRLSLAGGGTDLPEYYEKYGSHVITSAVNKNIFIFFKNWFDPAIRLSYSKTEIVDNVENIKHPVIREVFKYFKLKSHLEMAILADLPAGTGMGSSGSFTVGLLNAVSSFKGKKETPKRLAELAFHFQRNVLHEAGGKQDQYASSYGGIISMKINKRGIVKVEKIKIDPAFIKKIESRILCVYSGIQRSAAKIQTKYSKSITAEKKDIIDSLHGIKKNSTTMQSCLINERLEEIGELFEEHWNLKKKISRDISNTKINKWHDLALSSGAIGGKMLGAGGGGYMLFFCKEGKRNNVKKTLNKIGLSDIPIKFNTSGSSIINKIN